MCVCVYNIYIYIHIYIYVYKKNICKGGLPEMAVPQNGWSIMESPTKMDDKQGQPLNLWNPPYIYITYTYNRDV